MMNFIEFMGALSVKVTLSFKRPAFLCGSSLLSPILTKVLLEACLHPSITILRAKVANNIKVLFNHVTSQMNSLFS